jgi:hypothetical protein
MNESSRTFEAEADPTRSMREELIGMLISIPEEDNVYISKFRRGAFFVPSETIQYITEQIDQILEPEIKTKARELMTEILEQA